MSNKVFISCAVTASGDTASKHPDLPKTPEQIATASIEAAKAGAAIAHIHVREEDGTPSRRLELYKEVVDIVRSSDTDVILNLTTGMGGDLDIGQGDNPLDFGPMTDMANVMERIATLDALDCHPDIMDSVYRAHHRFGNLLHDKKYQINFRLEPGDIFSFNNRRLLHGRTEFDPNSGHRHLQGYYMDRDEIIGRLNYLKK